jgi:hypothetical protein
MGVSQRLVSPTDSAGPREAVVSQTARRVIGVRRRMPLLVGGLGVLAAIQIGYEIISASLIRTGGVFGADLSSLGTVSTPLISRGDDISLLLTALRYSSTLLVLLMLAYAGRLPPEMLAAISPRVAFSGKLSYLIRLGSLFTLLFCLVPSLIVLYTGEAARHGSYFTVKASLVVLLILLMGTGGILLACRSTSVTIARAAVVAFLGLAVAGLQRAIVSAPIPLTAIPVLAAVGAVPVAAVILAIWRMASAPADGDYSPGAPKSSR